MKTLQRRVLVGTTAAVAVVLAVAGWALYTLVGRALVDEVDRALTAQARLLASEVFQDGMNLHVEFVELAVEEFVDPEEGEFIQLWTGEHLLYASLEDSGYALDPTVAEPTGEWIDLADGVRGRVITYNFRPGPKEEDDDEEEEDDDEELEIYSAEAEQARLTLVIAGEARAADRVLATLRALLGVVGLVTLATAGIVLVGVVRRSLRPVTLVSESVAAIGETSLSTRLQPAGVPGELLPIVHRINELLERLEAAFERERAFSNEVAHELRTPLAGLRTTLEVTAKRSRSVEEYAEALAESATIAGQLQSMVERLLQLARLEGARFAVDSEPYLLGDVAVESWEPYAEQAVARDLRVDLAVENGVELNTDRELVEIILRNLYDNAVTYTEQGGEVRISTRSDDGLISLEVSNTGSNLSEEEVSAATQRFWRGDVARTEAALHCGLGLALVEKAAGALDGMVSLRSRTGGEFAVEVKFPA